MLNQEHSSIKRKFVRSTVECTLRRKLEDAQRGGWQIVSRYASDGYHVAVVEMDLKTRTRKALMK